MIDLNNILLFVTVVQLGGFSAAGHKLDMPANTISRRINKLEESLGVLLLIRTTRKLNLTTAGQHYFDQCLVYINGLEDANQSLIVAQQEPQGVIRITASIDFFKHFSSQWICDFMLQYPKVELSFILDNHNLDLIDDNIDIAIRMSKLEDSNLIAKRVAENKAGLFAYPGLFEHHKIPVQLEDLKQIPCILKPSESNGATWTLESRVDRQKHKIHVNGRFKVNTVVDQVHMVKMGMGVGLLPYALALPEVRQGNLVHILQDYGVDLGGIYIITPSLKYRSIAVQLLVNLFSEKLKKVKG